MVGVHLGVAAPRGGAGQAAAGVGRARGAWARDGGCRPTGRGQEALEQIARCCKHAATCPWERHNVTSPAEGEPAPPAQREVLHHAVGTDGLDTAQAFAEVGIDGGAANSIQTLQLDV